MASIRVMVRLAVAFLAAAAFAGPAGALPPEEAPPAVDLAATDTVKSLLDRHVGQTVTLKLSGGGDEVSGSVAKVNDKVVHLQRVAGREFYDAFVPLEKIAAVLVKARSK